MRETYRAVNIFVAVINFGWPLPCFPIGAVEVLVVSWVNGVSVGGLGMEIFVLAKHVSSKHSLLSEELLHTGDLAGGWYDVDTW